MKPILQAALAGTSRQPLAAAETGTPIDDLTARLPETEAERMLLLIAGATDMYYRAGKTGEPGGAVPERAPEEHQPVCSRQAAELIDSLFRGQYADLLPEALGRLAAAGLRLPPSLLPAALSVKQKEAQSAMAAVLGERGRWLSRFNPQWHWVAGTLAAARETSPEEIERIWHEGAPDQRRRALLRLRSENPAAAREWVQAVWRQEKADFRVGLLKVFETSLSPDDEPFLEAALDDRGANVRTEAAQLLGRLPGSALSARVRALADGLLDYVPAPANRLKSLVRSVFGKSEPGGTLTVRLPEELDNVARRDGVALKPPEGLGERAWWLTQILGLVPPAHWEQRFRAEPTALVSVAAADEWGLAVLEGWSRAVILHRASDWALALWERWHISTAAGSYYPRVRLLMLAALVELLPQAATESLVRRLLREDTGSQSPERQSILEAIPRPWSEGVAQVYVDALRSEVRARRVQPGPASIRWSYAPDTAARALPPQHLRPVQELWTDDELREADWQVRRFCETLRLREQIWKEIPA